jgi:hypothetical protein
MCGFCAFNIRTQIMQMAFFLQRVSKEQLTPNQLIASKHEMLFGKVVNFDKKETVSITVIRACLLCEYKLGTNATQAARKTRTAFGEVTGREHTAQKCFRKFV